VCVFKLSISNSSLYEFIRLVIANMNLSITEQPYLMVICLKLYGYLSDLYMSGAVNSYVLSGSLKNKIK